MAEPERSSASEPRSRIPLYKRFDPRSSTSQTVRTLWPWILLAAVLLVVGWFFVKPAPPHRVVIAAGPNDGAYKWFAEKYAKTFAENGVTLEPRETLGSVENYQLLDAEGSKGPTWQDDGVSVAMVQSGTCPEGIKSELRSVASLYLEPVWIFYRGGPDWELSNLRGKRVAVGPEGSGSRSIITRLLGVNGIEWVRGTSLGPPTTEPAAEGPAATTAPAASQPASKEPIAFLPQGGRSAADLLKAGRLDAAVFVFSPRHPLIAELLHDKNLKLMTFERHEAYSRIFPFLSDVKLPRGTVDLAQDLPHEDVYLLAPAANLVCREGLHPAIVALLIKAATIAHDRGDLLSPPGRLPSSQYVEFPVDPAAAEYFRAGPPFLQRYLPFWAAALVDRMKILLLPLITLLIPLARLAPPIYVWRMRSRIYRWYRVLREIDRKLREDAGTGAAAAAGADPARFDSEISTLQEMEKELSDENVPLSYMQEYYNLRLHTDFLRRRLLSRVGRADTDSPQFMATQ